MTDVPASTLIVRRAGADDLAAVFELASLSLGWQGDDADAAFFHWKHFENPFGESPMWVATERDVIVGFRTFVRWRFHDDQGSIVEAVRAVDTATHPSARGRGIFTKLTLHAVDELRTQGVKLIFNTPNDRSRAGYLKMGWSVIGRVPTGIMPTSVGSLFALATARKPARRWSVDTPAGEPAPDVLADNAAVDRLLSTTSASGLATARSARFLSWRYGFEPLRYRAMLAGSSPADGFIVFRLRQRGKAVEGVVCDALLSQTDRGVERKLLRRIARSSGADYLIWVQRQPFARGPIVRLPRIGPILTCRPLTEMPPPPLSGWRLTLGDIELF